MVFEFDTEPVPVPDGAKADKMEDAHCAFVDCKNRIAWDMWGLKKNDDGSWESKTGMKYSIDGNGAFDPSSFAMKDGESVHYYGPSCAAGGSCHCRVNHVRRGRKVVKENFPQNHYLLMHKF